MSNLAKILAVTTMLLIIISAVLVLSNMLLMGIIIFLTSMVYAGTAMAVMWLDIVDKADL
jgi:hypothetical protein